MSTTKKLLHELNTINGVAYLGIGYMYFADVVGDGTARPRIYTVINANGGVTLSALNDTNPRKRCTKIRDAIETAKRERDGVTLARNPDRPWFQNEKENKHV